MEAGSGKQVRKKTGKGWSTGLALALVGLWAGWLWAAGPQLKVPEPSYDFGEVAEGEIVSHEFVIQNTGTEALQIADVRPG